MNFTFDKKNFLLVKKQQTAQQHQRTMSCDRKFHDFSCLRPFINEKLRTLIIGPVFGPV